MTRSARLPARSATVPVERRTEERGERPAAGAAHVPMPITPHTSVRSILAAYPATAAVFDRHGLMGCGGDEGPQEPLDLFAGAHHIDVGALLAELQAAAAAPVETEPAAAPRPVAPSPATYRRFVATSLAFALSFGAALGALLLANSTLPYGVLGGLSADAARTAHAHAQVFGFAVLFIMGVAYHALPRIKAAPLAAPRLVAASFWLQAGGVLLIVAGALGLPAGAAAHGLGAAALLAAAGAFGWVIDRTLAAGAPAPERFEPWLRGGCAWLVVAAALTVAVAAGARALQPAVWEAALYGFAASWIFGFSRRILPAFMGIAPLARGRGWLCAAYQAAVAAWVGVAVVQAWWPVPALRGAAGVALAAAGGAVVWQLQIFAAREAPGGAVDQRYQKFVTAAYAWLLVGLACGPAWSAAAAVAGVPMPALVLDFGRHAITLGFLAQMIIGISTRIIPVFSGKALWSPGWREATFHLLNAAVLVRGLQVVVELGGPEAAWPWIAASGVLGLAAFVAFTVNLGLTLAGRGTAPARAAAVAAPPGADTIVADLLAIDGALDLLVARGFAPLRNPLMRATMAHTVTLRQACRMQGIAVEPLVDELRALAARQPGTLRPPPGP